MFMSASFWQRKSPCYISIHWWVYLEIYFTGVHKTLPGSSNIKPEFQSFAIYIIYFFHFQHLGTILGDILIFKHFIECFAMTQERKTSMGGGGDGGGRGMMTLDERASLQQKFIVFSIHKHKQRGQKLLPCFHIDCG